MVAKEQARQVVESMPESASLEDIIYALYVRAKFNRGEKEIREGRGIPHEQATGRLQKWLR
ncbi:MAG: hypothetical protein BIFFINMI_03219 [Phycisphaerae bacterium]|nr:hypothetical protein [Phycisphaerae bacterium]